MGKRGLQVTEGERHSGGYGRGSGAPAGPQALRLVALRLCCLVPDHRRLFRP